MIGREREGRNRETTREETHQQTNREEHKVKKTMTTHY